MVRALEIPVVLVVGLRLGCMNHARLSTAAIMADGLRCIGWIANTIDPHMARIEENLALLRQRLPIPYWGTYRISPRDKPGDIGHTATSTGGLNHWHAVMLKQCCGLESNRDHVAIRKILMPTQLKE
ncbi:dethiobiotin synthase, partial [Curtobacterium flaccumfaciens pv. poinsettiae]|nr:dethiobiotin synthase [Curtobacterium flaccumfaciens pv. poinsettiae]